MAKVFENPSNSYQETLQEGFSMFAFLFGGFWYMYHGMFGKGILYLVVTLIAGLLTLGVGAIAIWVWIGFVANKDLERKYLRDGWKIRAQA
jgi:VIT1/CCC1 family predicted Fe2+/Mn2+ transporter